MEPIITCYLPRHMKTHVSFQQKNLFIYTFFASAGNTQSKINQLASYIDSSLKNNMVVILLLITNKVSQIEM